MAPPLPPRYRIEIRLGRDEDVEEWLATDLELSRPVLIRVIGPEAPAARRKSFLKAVQEASRVSHNHVAGVFAAAEADGSAYAATEWTGGITLANRIAAGSTPPIAEFLSNAAGLADGLAALDAESVVHGAIDPGAILYSGAHPAKLAGFGRVRRTDSAQADVQALGAALESALTGRPAGILAPSQVIDALPPNVDDALRHAQEAAVDARRLAELMLSIPYSPPLRRASRWSWRWLIPAALLAVAAIGLVWWGSLLDVSPTSRVLAPAIPGPTVTRPLPTTTTTTEATSGTRAVTDPPEPVDVRSVAAFDPLGDGQEHSGRVDRLIDGNPDTAWRTERYFDPLPLLKGGVGLAFEVSGSPSSVELLGLSVGTAFRIMWAESLLDIEDEGWDVASEELAGATTVRVPLPDRSDGVWLVWLTDLPPEEDGYLARIAEVQFHD